MNFILAFKENIYSAKKDRLLMKMIANIEGQCLLHQLLSRTNHSSYVIVFIAINLFLKSEAQLKGLLNISSYLRPALTELSPLPVNSVAASLYKWDKWHKGRAS